MLITSISFLISCECVLLGNRNTTDAINKARNIHSHFREQLVSFRIGILLLCIFSPLCRGTIRQYVEQVLRLWTVLVFPPPLEFSCAHIYSEVLPTHNSHKILIYTVKNLRFLKLRLKVIYMIKIV